MVTEATDTLCKVCIHTDFTHRYGKSSRCFSSVSFWLPKDWDWPKMQVNKIPAENSSARMLWNITPGFWLQATTNRVCGLTAVGTRISVGEIRGVRLRGLIMGNVLPLIFWLRFSPGGKWLKMAALLWPLRLDVSTWVLVNKDPPPSNKRLKREPWSKCITNLPRTQWAIKKEKINNNSNNNNNKQEKKEKKMGEKNSFTLIGG